jgi:hypothetical protein
MNGHPDGEAAFSLVGIMGVVGDERTYADGLGVGSSLF